MMNALADIEEVIAILRIYGNKRKRRILSLRKLGKGWKSTHYSYKWPKMAVYFIEDGNTNDNDTTNNHKNLSFNQTPHFHQLFEYPAYLRKLYKPDRNEIFFTAIDCS